MEKESLTGKRFALELRGRVLAAIREFFRKAGFLEVQTPVRTPSPAPEFHIDAVPADGWFLSTSPELYMKRLLAAGYRRIFQISPVFRRGEFGRLHHPEFTLLEWYRLGEGYEALQEDCGNLLKEVCRAVGGGNGFRRGDAWLDVEAEWGRLAVREAFQRFAGWEPGASPDEDRFDLDLVTKVEPNLGRPSPCFLVDYPASQAALARLKPGDPSVAERFELYWDGVELANGFSELTDPEEQRVRFERTHEALRSAGRTVYPMPEAFLESLRDLSDCAGVALGVDRLVMIVSGAEALDLVVAFPPGT
jgi:lysyl-tRNA synthetase class 2